MGDTADAARRNFLSQAMLLSLVLRNGGSLVVYAVMVTTEYSVSAVGTAFALAAGTWATYRLITHSTTARVFAVDYAVTIVACLTIPMLASDAHVHLSTFSLVAIAGTAIISFTVFSPWVNVVLTLGVAAAYVLGTTAFGWGHVGGNIAVYFAVLWLAATLNRVLMLRVTDSVDAARADRHAAELQHEVDAAVREYDREQLRLLHDTVASTLLIVGTGSAVSPTRIATQARRDLEVFDDRSWAPTPPADLVAALRDNIAHITTPVTLAGPTQMWLDGATATIVAAAAREALTNVDRHAAAAVVAVTIQPGLVRIADDGCGFDATQPTHGYGLANSIAARMRRLGGESVVTTAPGRGTTVELRWPTSTPVVNPADPERMIERARTGYSLMLTAYAIANLLAIAPTAMHSTAHPKLQLALIAVAAAITLSTVVRRLGVPGLPTRAGIAALLVVSLVQSASLPVAQLDTDVQWMQGAIGWCALPLLLNERLRYSISILVLCWTIPIGYAVVHDLSMHNIVDIGYGTVSVLLIQLCGLFFDNLIRGAAADAAAETATRKQLLTANRIADAVQAEYLRRYADLAETIRPLLVSLADGAPLDAAVQQHAQNEYQRLRTLFDQSSIFQHVLLRELRPHIDAAQDRGVAVAINVDGALPTVDEAAARRIAHLLDLALAATTTAARITVTGESTGAEISVVCHGAKAAEIPTEIDVGANDGFDVTTLDDTVWITFQLQLAERPASHDLAGHPA